jgi:hypothetical protein
MASVGILRDGCMPSPLTEAWLSSWGHTNIDDAPAVPSSEFVMRSSLRLMHHHPYLACAGQGTASTTMLRRTSAWRPGSTLQHARNIQVGVTKRLLEEYEPDIT